MGEVQGCCQLINGASPVWAFIPLRLSSILPYFMQNMFKKSLYSQTFLMDILVIYKNFFHLLLVFTCFPYFRNVFTFPYFRRCLHRKKLTHCAHVCCTQNFLPPKIVIPPLKWL